MGTTAGSLGSAALYYGFAFLMVIWMVVKIARSSGLMAVATFFIWPLAIVSLIKNWGDPDTDIRIPFFATVLALGLSLFMVSRGVDNAMLEYAPYFSEEDLALIAEENPEAYAQIMQARAQFEADGGTLEDEGGSDLDLAPASIEAADAPSSASSATTTSVDDAQAPAPRPPVEIDPEVELAKAVKGLSYLYHAVELKGANAQLVVPPRFRFIPAVRLSRIAELRSQPLQPGTLGWVTHDTIDLAHPEAWAVEVRLLDIGATRLTGSNEEINDELRALADTVLLDTSKARFGSEGFVPRWDAERALLTWSLSGKDGRVEQRAVRPLRQAVLQFSVSGLEPSQRELGLRATRLLAASVVPAEGHAWQYASEAGTAASTNLIEWMRGRRAAASTKP